MSDIAIRIEDKSFTTPDGRRRPVLRDIAIDLAPGSVLCLFGPSGCGKTTLLRLIAGLDSDFEGQISFGPAAQRPRVGYVFQEPRLLPWADARDNVALVVDQADAAARAEAMLRDVGLAEQAGQRPGQLSGGQRRRVALARALVGQPDLLLLDEPFASLDREAAQRQRRHLIDVLRRRPTTTLLVTHDREEAAHLADRIHILGGTPTTLQHEIEIPADRRRGIAPLPLADWPEPAG